MPDLQAAKAEYERARLASVGPYELALNRLVDAADALIAAYEAELLRRDSAPVICPDVRGVRCMAYWLPLGAFPETKALCLATSKDATPGEPCPCVREET